MDNIKSAVIELAQDAGVDFFRSREDGCSCTLEEFKENMCAHFGNCNAFKNKPTWDKKFSGVMTESVIGKLQSVDIEVSKLDFFAAFAVLKTVIGGKSANNTIAEEAFDLAEAMAAESEKRNAAKPAQ